MGAEGSSDPNDASMMDSRTTRARVKARRALRRHVLRRRRPPRWLVITVLGLVTVMLIVFATAAVSALGVRQQLEAGRDALEQGREALLDGRTAAAVEAFATAQREFEGAAD